MSGPFHHTRRNICQGHEHLRNMKTDRVDVRKRGFDAECMAIPITKAGQYLSRTNRMKRGSRGDQGEIRARTTSNTACGRVDERRLQKRTIFAVGVTMT